MKILDVAYPDIKKIKSKYDTCSDCIFYTRKNVTAGYTCSFTGSTVLIGCADSSTDYIFVELSVKDKLKML